ncbi:MAG: VC0807 family protein [Acidimicrobiales bacterium]
MVRLPSLLASLRHGLPALIEGVVGPFAVFYVLVVVAGERGALIGALVWCYGALARHLLHHRRPPAIVVLGAAVLTVRTVISFVTGSMFFYFAQPTLGTALVALMFLATAVARRPFIEKLARDFCPLDPTVLARPAVRQFFLQISVLWGAVLLANAGLVFWLLLTSSLKTFLLERTASSWSMTAIAAVCSTAWFLRAMRRDGVRVHWGTNPAGAGEP